MVKYWGYPTFVEENLQQVLWELNPKLPTCRSLFKSELSSCRTLNEWRQLVKRQDGWEDIRDPLQPIICATLSKMRIGNNRISDLNRHTRKRPMVVWLWFGTTMCERFLAIKLNAVVGASESLGAIFFISAIWRFRSVDSWLECLELNHVPSESHSRYLYHRGFLAIFFLRNREGCFGTYLLDGGGPNGYQRVW